MKNDNDRQQRLHPHIDLNKNKNTSPHVEKIQTIDHSISNIPSLTQNITSNSNDNIRNITDKNPETLDNRDNIQNTNKNIANTSHDNITNSETLDNRDNIQNIKENITDESPETLDNHDDIQNIKENIADTSHDNLTTPETSTDDHLTFSQTHSEPVNQLPAAHHDDVSSALVAVKPEKTDCAPSETPTRFGMLKNFSFFNRHVWTPIYERVITEASQIQTILSVPKDESIIYLLQSENKHDFLFFNDLCLKKGLPLAYASNGSDKFKYGTLYARLSGLFKGRRKPFEPTELADLVAQHKPILIFLNQYGRHERNNALKTQETFDEISKRCLQNPALKVHCFAIGTIWERRTESVEHSAFNDIYGTPAKPSAFRRFFAVLPSLTQVFFKIGLPLCLIQHLPFSAHNDNGHGKQLRLSYDEEIRAMHTQVNGPKVKPHQQLLREIVESDAFQAELSAIAQQTGIAQQELVHDARKILDRAASKFSLVADKLFTAVLMPLWNIIYDGLYIDPEQLNHLRDLSKNYRLVFVPSHKSHIDYLVLSVMFFQNGILPPHIAAGDNLNFFPIGSILRRGGAFFIRRSFKGDILYGTCIRFYIDKILHEGYPIEFFIEGGRSRTGQVLQPKFGILRMIAQTVRRDPSLPILLIPCATTYEKVIEDAAYKNEQAGATKQKENFSSLIKTTKLLISKYGQIYISFADPISLNDALHVNDAQHPQTEQSLTDDIDTLSVILMQRINQATTVTMSSLLSCALLNTPTHPVALDVLLKDAAFFLDLLMQHGALISPVLKNALSASRASICAANDAPQNLFQDDALIAALKDPILETLQLFEKNNTIKRRGNDFMPDVEIAEQGRLQMTFYKNILLYAIIDDIYLACALKQCAPCSLDTLENAFRTLSTIFAIEFADNDLKTRFTRAVEAFQNRHWLSLSDSAAIEPDAAPLIDKLLHAMAHHILSYAFVFNHAQSLLTSTEESKFIKTLLDNANDHIRDKKLLPESRSKVIFTHAVQKLIKLGSLTAAYEQTGRKSAKYLQYSAPIPQPIADSLSSLSHLIEKDYA